MEKLYNVCNGTETMLRILNLYKSIQNLFVLKIKLHLVQALKNPYNLLLKPDSKARTLKELSVKTSQK